MENDGKTMDQKRLSKQLPSKSSLRKLFKNPHQKKKRQPPIPNKLR